jgi:hypothetical protein
MQGRHFEKNAPDDRFAANSLREIGYVDPIGFRDEFRKPATAPDTGKLSFARDEQSANDNAEGNREPAKRETHTASAPIYRNRTAFGQVAFNRRIALSERPQEHANPDKSLGQKAELWLGSSS